MKVAQYLTALHARAKANRWMRYFALFNRIALAAGFIPSGLTKVLGERFTDLSVNHPMGNYLEALYHTGYYYTFIGYVQVLAAVLLLIPRTATLGAFLYFPLILNICILSLAVGFDGSLVTSPLMVMANLYLLCWDYDRWRFILPWEHPPTPTTLPTDRTFPLKFFLGVAFMFFLTVFMARYGYVKKTRNTLEDCERDCKSKDDTKACYTFCACIHEEGKSYSVCEEALRKSKAAP